MIYHDNTFETLATAPVKSSNVEVVQQVQDPYGYYDGSIAWTSSDYLMSVTIDAVGSFLGTATKKAVVKLLGIIDDGVVGDLYQVRYGLYDNDPSVVGFNDISEGFYYIDSIDFDYEAGSTTIVMYDHMWTANNTPYPTGLTYPCTVYELAQQIATALNVDLSAGFELLPNAGYEIAEDLYTNISNATLQTVIQELAAATGTSARITDTTLVFSKYEISDEVLTSNELKKLKIGNEYGPVSSVVLGRVPQNDNIVLANGSPATNTITAINTTSNLFTITGNEMTDGTMVRINSDGTLPSPLEANTNYFVYTNGNANTFYLTTTYADAIAGTNLIDLTTSGSGTIELESTSIQEVQINNVEILDDDRETLLPDLYAALLGINWTASDSETVGLGWHEVGDVISFSQTDRTINSFISEVHLVLAGSVRESLVSVIPQLETINYQTAGGILKTIYNTEIKVDRQNNDIESIVSRQDVYQNETLASFTDVYQTIDSVTTTIQSVGGGNLILNSVGYAKATDGSLSFWTQSGSGTVTSYSSAGALAAGGTSGNAIDLAGNTVQIKQTIPVATTSHYSIGFRVTKALGDGSATVTLSNDVSSYEIEIESGTKYDWAELKLEDISPDQNYWDVTIAVTSTTTKIEITDLRVLLGSTLSQWQQSQSEILNAQVALTTEGIRVSSNIYAGDYTLMTPLEFAGYSNVSGTNKRVFSVNRDTTEVTKLLVENSMEFRDPDTVGSTSIRAVLIPTGTQAGLAFVGGIS